MKLHAYLDSRPQEIKVLKSPETAIGLAQIIKNGIPMGTSTGEAIRILENNYFKCSGPHEESTQEDYYYCDLVKKPAFAEVLFCLEKLTVYFSSQNNHMSEISTEYNLNCI